VIERAVQVRLLGETREEGVEVRLRIRAVEARVRKAWKSMSVIATFAAASRRSSVHVVVSAPSVM
jgi:hypothetical protein